MTHQLNNRGFSDSFVFQLKDFLSSFPKLKNNSNGNSVFDNQLRLLLTAFQQFKKLKSANGQLNHETFRALGEEMSPLQIQMATMFQPELRYLFVGEPRDGFLNRSIWNGLPYFERLWNIHRGNDPTYIDPKTGTYPKGWLHQCAINMSYALQAAGVNMSSYKGKTIRTYVISKDAGVANSYWTLARDIYQLSAWVLNWYQGLAPGKSVSSPLNSYFKVGETWVPDTKNKLDWSLVSWLKSQRDNEGYPLKGIIILYNHWRDDFQQIRGHIDLWDGEKIKRGEEFELAASEYFILMPLK